MVDNEFLNDAVLQEERRLNTVQRLSGMVFNPGETLRDILARPYCLAAALAAIAVTLVTTVLILPKVQAFSAWQIESAAPGTVNPEDIAVYVTGASIGGALIAPVVIWLVWALALKFLNMFAGNRVSFGRFFAVSVYAYVPMLLGGLVTAVMIMLSRAENLPYVTTSLAALFPGMEIGFVYMLLTRVDPFTLWTIALLGIGGAQAMQVSIRTTVGYLLVLYVLYTLASAGLGAAFTPSM